MSVPRDRLVWLAWRVDEEGGVEVAATLQVSGEEAFERTLWKFADLDEAARALGRNFREVAEQVLESGRRQGRWRP